MTSVTRHQSAETRLSERLERVASLVPACRCLFDIGTDHGYLPIQLIREHRCQVAVAADIRSGPLERASHHIRKAGLSDLVETRLTDGLKDLAVTSDDVVVIAGLGGNEIRDILAASQPNCRAIILQPMKSAPDLRLWLYRSGYVIDQEILALDRGRYYPIMSCVRTGHSRYLSPLEAWVGPVLLHSQQPDLTAWLSVLRRRLEKHSRSQPDLRLVSDQIATVLARSATGGESR